MRVLLQLGLSLVLLVIQCAPGTAALSSECRRQCGTVEIPYPFGIDPNCSLAGFDLSCKVQDGISKPFIGDFEVLSISLTRGTMRVLNYIVAHCYNTSTGSMEFMGRFTGYVGQPSSPYRLSDVQNRFTVIGCNALYLIADNDGTGYQGLGVSTCRNFSDLVDGSCSGIGCSQTMIPKSMYNYATASLDSFNTSQIWEFNRCSYAVLMEATAFNFITSYVSTTKFNDTNEGRVPMVLDWAIRNQKCDIATQNKTGTYACLSSNSVCIDSVNDNGYMCNCSQGYKGNPYLPDGCQDVDECSDNPCPSGGSCHNTVGGFRCSCGVGRKLESNTCNPDTGFIVGVTMGLFGAMVIIMITVFWGQMIIQKRKLNKVRQDYFQQHGGLLLFDRMKSEIGLAFTVFSEAELIQASENFDNGRILGKGGHGTVYKGIIKNNMSVAIKRCALVDERQKKEFGQEMLILSQINHKNIVKLLGCCLEVEVPILVYEFVPNGTLFELIHGKNKELQVSFSTLLRIAHEAAEGISFLHSYASPPIIHGDVKTSNILLDDNYMAKVSDFGASILAPSDEQQFVTMVQGTCGYLDPEYMQTCQLTDKSDVYSFGVILLEILTGQLPLKLEGSEKQRSLSLIFLSAMKENNLDAVLASHVKGQESMELLRGLADLAKRCLDMCGDNRPSMKEVAALVFYAGKPPKGVKTDWIMHEYRLADVDRSAAARKKSNNALRLDDWVLCRIYNKKGVIEKYDTVDSGAEDVKPAAAPPAKNPRSSGNYAAAPTMKIELSDYGFYQHPSPPATEMLCFDRSGSADRDSDPHSMPRLHTDSSSSDRALSSPSPDFPSDMDYAESQHPAAGDWPGDDWGCGIDDEGFVIDESLIFDPPSPGYFASDAAAFGDMLTFLQKPF